MPERVLPIPTTTNNEYEKMKQFRKRLTKFLTTGCETTLKPIHAILDRQLVSAEVQNSPALEGIWVVQPASLCYIPAPPVWFLTTY